MKYLYAYINDIVKNYIVNKINVMELAYRIIETLCHYIE